MWDLIVSVPDHCLSFYFVDNENSLKSRRASNAYTNQSVLLSVCLFHL